MPECTIAPRELPPRRRPGAQNRECTPDSVRSCVAASRPRANRVWQPAQRSSHGLTKSDEAMGFAGTRRAQPKRRNRTK
jgi:hypothetical protein